MKSIIKSVKPESIVSIEVSGAFLNTLNGVLTHMLYSKGEEKALEILSDIKDADDDMSLMSEDSKDIYVILSLIKTIDSKFSETGKVIDNEVEY